MQSTRYREAEERVWAAHGVAPAERFVTLPSTGTAVRTLHAGAGPPVLLLHGASSAAATWAPLTARLAGLSVIMVDRPGCGLSDPIPPFRDAAELNGFADRFLGELLGALDLARSSVVATSFGGLFALRGAAATPSVVHRVVQLGWTVGAPADDIPASMRFANLPGIGRLMTHLPPTRRLVLTIMRQLGLGPALDAGRVPDADIDAFLALLRHTPTMRNEVATNRRIATFRHGFDPAITLDGSVLGRVAAPVLFLWGDRDVMGGEAIARPFVAQLPHARLELLDDVGHVPWLERPDRIATEVGEFLRAGPAA